MGIFGYLIVGLIAGALAKFIMPGRQGGGFVATLILGVVGAMVGGLLSNLIFNGRLSLSLDGGFWASLAIAVVGSLIVLVVYGFVQKRQVRA